MRPIHLKVLELIAKGMSTREISETLGISDRSIRKYYIPLLKRGLTDNSNPYGESFLVRHRITEKGKELLNGVSS